MKGNEELLKRISLIPYGGDEEDKEESPNDYFISRCEPAFIENALKMKKSGMSDDEIISVLESLFMAISDYYGN